MALDIGETDDFVLMEQDCEKQSQNFALVPIEDEPDTFNIYCQGKLLVVDTDDDENEWKKLQLVFPHQIRENESLGHWKWLTIWDGYEIFALINVGTDLAMDVFQGSTEVGVAVGAYPYHGGEPQQCKLKLILDANFTTRNEF